MPPGPAGLVCVWNKEKGRLADAGGLRIRDGGVLPLSVVEDRCRLLSGVIDSRERHADDPREAVIGGVQFEHGRPFVRWMIGTRE